MGDKNRARQRQPPGARAVPRPGVGGERSERVERGGSKRGGCEKARRTCQKKFQMAYRQRRHDVTTGGLGYAEGERDRRKKSKQWAQNPGGS